MYQKLRNCLNQKERAVWDYISAPWNREYFMKTALDFARCIHEFLDLLPVKGFPSRMGLFSSSIAIYSSFGSFIKFIYHFSVASTVPSFYERRALFKARPQATIPHPVKHFKMVFDPKHLGGAGFRGNHYFGLGTIFLILTILLNFIEIPIL